MTDLKKMLDTINKSLEGKTIRFVKHEPERIYTLSRYDKPAIGFDTKPCDLPEYRQGAQYLSVKVDGKPAQLRLPSAAYRRLIQAVKHAEVERDSDEPIHVWMSRDGEGYRTDFRALVTRLDTEYSPGPLVEAFKAAIEPSYEARPVGLLPGPALKAEVLAVSHKKAICQCSMRDLMSGVPHRSDCPEKPR